MTDFPGGSDGKASAGMRETRVQFLGREDPLEKEKATSSSILAWKIPWLEEPDRLQPMESDTTKQLHFSQHSGHLKRALMRFLQFKRLFLPSCGGGIYSAQYIYRSNIFVE